MVNKNKVLCSFLTLPIQPVISRSHLPTLLQKVNVEVFDNLLFTHYGLRLNPEEKQWFSGDGKELRGSIESGEKRGQAVVQLVGHQSRDVVAQDYYDGQKESEIPTLRSLLLGKKIASQKITLDALHLCPKTTEIIFKAGGVFLIGLKGNQQKLLSKMTKCANELSPIHQKTTFDSGHGRIEHRKDWLYDISKQRFDERWSKNIFANLVKVQRTCINQKNGKISQEISYYISNEAKKARNSKKSKNETFKAVRQHWVVETNNYIRDVTLREDQLKSKKKPVQKVFAELRTLAIKMLQSKKVKNLTAQLELFQVANPDSSGMILMLC